MVYTILGNVALVFWFYFLLRYFVVCYWERTSAQYVAAYRKAFPLDFKVSRKSVKISFWLAMCPWKWHVKHCFDPRAWKALCEKFQIR